MQCPSCQFQNMPGSQRCARCAAMLSLATVAIDVHPPRATRRDKALAGLWRYRLLGERFRELLRPHVPTFQVEQETGRFAPANILRALVPGWPHWRRGERILALVHAFFFAVCLGWGVLLSSSLTGHFLLGIALSIHTSSFVTGLVVRFTTYRDRVLFTACSMILILLAIYIPAGMAFSRLAMSLTLYAPLPPFETGEILWYRPTTSVHTSQYILYDSPASQLQTAREQVVMLAPGLRINRVLATTGQTITWQEGQMLVDGAAVEDPLPTHLAPQWSSFTVPAGHVIVNPANLLPQGAAPQAWRTLALIPESQVRGPVFFRSWPLGRAGFLE